MAAKNSVGYVVELKFNASDGKNTNKRSYLFAIRRQANRVYLFINKLFPFQGSGRHGVFHDLYERQRRGLELGPFLRALEGNAIFGSPSNTIDLFNNRWLEQQHGNKAKNEGNGWPNQEIGHMSIEMANLTVSIIMWHYLHFFVLFWRCDECEPAF